MCWRNVNGRDIKNKYNIATSTKLTASAKASVEITTVLNENSSLICRLAGVEKFTAGADIEKPKNAATAIVDDIQIYLHDVIDPNAERTRLQTQKEQVENAKKAVAKVRPFAVDSSSGVEKSLGKKDPRKVKALIKAVKGWKAQIKC